MCPGGDSPLALDTCHEEVSDVGCCQLFKARSKLRTHERSEVRLDIRLGFCLRAASHTAPQLCKPEIREHGFSLYLV